MTEPYETIVVGAGPAGLSAALVLGRCMRRTLVCDTGQHRNQSSQALHCFMSRDGIAPRELLAIAREQLQQYDTVYFARAEVSRIDRLSQGFAVTTDNGLLQATTLLIASGVVDELPAIEGIRDLFGRSVHVCPYCDGWEHRNAPVAAFGKGDKGANFALLLRQWTDDLVLCTHGPAEIGRDCLERLKQSGIAVREEKIERVVGKHGCLEALRFEDGTRLFREALFFSTGQHPRSRLLEHIGCRYEAKGVACDPDGQTSIPGLYVAGDVSRDVQLAIIAAAEGAQAALAINKALLAGPSRQEPN